MQYARCASLEIQIMINAIHDVLAIKNALLKLPAQKSFESGYFGIKAALLILKPAPLILKCSLTPDTSGLKLLTTVRNLVFTCVLLRENRVSNDLPLLFHNPPKTEDFLKYYINNKYKQLNIRTMAESFEGKK
jgi:hypothetical protein